MFEYGVTLAPLALARDEIKEGDAANTGDDPILFRALEFVTARIERLTGLNFFPETATEYVDGWGDHVDNFTGILRLPRPLLSLESVTVDGMEWILGTDFYLNPRNGTPITGLRAAQTKFWASGVNWQENVVIEGVWGYRENYASAYHGAGEAVPSGGILANATSFTSALADGSDAYRRTPRYSAGTLLRLGGTELAAVLECDYEGDVVSLRRGLFGTAAEAHAEADSIEIFDPDPAAVRAALRWASYLYKRRGQFVKTTTEQDGVTVVTFPEDAPEEVLNILAELRTGEGFAV